MRRVIGRITTVVVVIALVGGVWLWYYRLIDADLGPILFHTSFQVADNVHDSGYRIKDGDAAYLPEGTAVQSVVGFSPRFRLAAKNRGRIVLYEVTRNPSARKGEDLLDLRSKVKRIAVASGDWPKIEYGSITDPASVARLVDLVLAAPVRQDRAILEGKRYSIVFDVGGEPVVRSYHLATGELGAGIVTPDVFRLAMAQTAAGH